MVLTELHIILLIAVGISTFFLGAWIATDINEIKNKEEEK